MCMITNIDPHTLFLFFPQFIELLIFYCGIFALLFSKSPIINATQEKKKFIFLLVLFNPFEIITFSYMAPFNLIVAFAPIVVFISFNITTKRYISFLVIIIFISIGAHIYGLFFIVLVLICFITSIMASLQKNRQITLTWILSIIIILLTLGLLAFPKLLAILLKFILTTLSFSSSSINQFLNSFLSGGILFNYYLNIVSVFSYWKIIEMVSYFGPVFYIIVSNQLYYYRCFKNKSKFHEKNNLIRFFADCFLPFICLGLFYGYDQLSLYRMAAFPLLHYKFFSLTK